MSDPIIKYREYKGITVGDVNDIITYVNSMSSSPIGDYVVNIGKQGDLYSALLSNGQQITWTSGGSGTELTPETLAEVLEGSPSVVVDLNEEGDKLQVRLDNNYIISNVKNLTSTTGTLTAAEFAKINENNYFTYNSTEKLTFLKWDLDNFYFSNDNYELEISRTSPYNYELSAKNMIANVSTGSNKIIFLKKDGSTLEVNFKTLANQSIIGLGNFAIPVSINIGDLPQYEKTEYSISQGVYNFIVSNFDNISLIIDYDNSGETFTAYSSQRYKQVSSSRTTYHFRTAKLFLDDDENFQFDIAFYQRDGQYYLRYIYDSAGGGGITYFIHSVSFDTIDGMHYQINAVTQSGGTYGNLDGFWYDIKKIVGITGTPNLSSGNKKIFFNGALADNNTIFVRGIDDTFTPITDDIAKIDVDSETFQDNGVEPL